MGAHSKRTTQRRKLRLLVASAAVAGIVGGTAISTGALPITPGPLHVDGHRFNDGYLDDLDDLDDETPVTCPTCGENAGQSLADDLLCFNCSPPSRNTTGLMTLDDYFQFNWNGRGYVG